MIRNGIHYRRRRNAYLYLGALRGYSLVEQANLREHFRKNPVKTESAPIIQQIAEEEEKAGRWTFADRSENIVNMRLADAQRRRKIWDRQADQQREKRLREFNKRRKIIARAMIKARALA